MLKSHKNHMIATCLRLEESFRELFPDNKLIDHLVIKANGKEKNKCCPFCRQKNVEILEKKIEWVLSCPDCDKVFSPKKVSIFKRSGKDLRTSVFYLYLFYQDNYFNPWVYRVLYGLRPESIIRLEKIAYEGLSIYKPLLIAPSA